MVEQQRAINLPGWWSGDVDRISNRLRKEIRTRHFPANQGNLILSAMDIASKYHEHQERANGVGDKLDNIRDALNHPKPGKSSPGEKT